MADSTISAAPKLSGYTTLKDAQDAAKNIKGNEAIDFDSATETFSLRELSDTETKEVENKSHQTSDGASEGMEAKGVSATFDPNAVAFVIGQSKVGKTANTTEVKASNQFSSKDAAITAATKRGGTEAVVDNANGTFSLYKATDEDIDRLKKNPDYKGKVVAFVKNSEVTDIPVKAVTTTTDNTLNTGSFIFPKPVTTSSDFGVNFSSATKLDTNLTNLQSFAGNNTVGSLSSSTTLAPNLLTPLTLPKNDLGLSQSFNLSPNLFLTDYKPKYNFDNLFNNDYLSNDFSYLKSPSLTESTNIVDKSWNSYLNSGTDLDLDDMSDLDRFSTNLFSKSINIYDKDTLSGIKDESFLKGVSDFKEKEAAINDRGTKLRNTLLSLDTITDDQKNIIKDAEVVFNKPFSDNIPPEDKAKIDKYIALTRDLQKQPNLSKELKTEISEVGKAFKGISAERLDFNNQLQVVCSSEKLANLSGEALKKQTEELKALKEKFTNDNKAKASDIFDKILAGTDGHQLTASQKKIVSEAKEILASETGPSTDAQKAIISQYTALTNSKSNPLKLSDELKQEISQLRQSGLNLSKAEDALKGAVANRTAELVAFADSEIATREKKLKDPSLSNASRAQLENEITEFNNLKKASKIQPPEAAVAMTDIIREAITKRSACLSMAESAPEGEKQQYIDQANKYTSDLNKFNAQVSASPPHTVLKVIVAAQNNSLTIPGDLVDKGAKLLNERRIEAGKPPYTGSSMEILTKDNDDTIANPPPVDKTKEPEFAEVKPSYTIKSNAETIAITRQTAKDIINVFDKCDKMLNSALDNVTKCRAEYTAMKIKFPEASALLGLNPPASTEDAKAESKARIAKADNEEINSNDKRIELLEKQLSETYGNFDTSSADIGILLSKFRDIIKTLDLDTRALHSATGSKVELSRKFSKMLKENRERWDELDKSRKQLAETYKGSANKPEFIEKFAKETGLNSLQAKNVLDAIGVKPFLA